VELISLSVFQNRNTVPVSISPYQKKRADFSLGGRKITEHDVFVWGLEFDMEIYCLQSKLGSDSFLNNLRLLFKKELTNPQLTEAGFMALLNRKCPITGQLIFNTGSNYPRQYIVRSLSTPSTSITRAEGATLLVNFMNDKKLHRFVPDAWKITDMNTIDGINDSLDEHLMDKDVDDIFSQLITEEQSRQGVLFYHNNTDYAKMAWSEPTDNIFATQLGFPRRPLS
jgi:hypothetical protein